MENLNSGKMFLEVENFLKIIDDSIRMALLFIIIREKEVTVDYLRDNLGIKSNTIYYHLNMLERAGIVSIHKEQVEGTNLNRKVYHFDQTFLSRKRDPEWKNLLKKNIKTAFLMEMYIAVASLMEAIQNFKKMSNQTFMEYLKDKKPQCDVLFLQKKQYTKLQLIINRYFKELGDDYLTELLSRSHEGYIYTIFAYPPV